MGRKMDIKMPYESFRYWTPIRVYNHNQQPFVDWCYMGNERFTRPFYEDTINQRFRQPFNLLFRHQTHLEFLGELYERQPGLRPSGFIFHMSRCGSTLVSQMLAAIAQNVVISEPPAIDLILRFQSDAEPITDEQRINYLKWIVNALGQQRNSQEKHFFIKFDSWSALDLNLILRAFPDVPWIFLYRNPVEVIVSQMLQRGAQMIPGIMNTSILNLNLAQVLQMPPEEYCARILERICQNALRFLDEADAMPLNYTELPEAVTTRILKHFRLSYESEDLEQMKASAQFNAKTPQLTFEPDSEAKRQQASIAAQEAAAKWVNPLYEQLQKVSDKFQF